MLAKYKVKQNCFFDFRNFKEGEIILVEEEMGNKMKGLLEPHERKVQKETQGRTDKQKSKAKKRKLQSAVNRPDAKPEKNKTSEIVNYIEQLTFEVDDERPAQNDGEYTKRKNGGAGQRYKRNGRNRR